MQNGMLHGQGCFSWPDHKRYAGEYSNDLKHGRGVFRWADGSIYDGLWVDGQMHGEAVFQGIDGVFKHGEWSNGTHIKWIKETSEVQLPERVMANPKHAKEWSSRQVNRQ